MYSAPIIHAFRKKRSSAELEDFRLVSNEAVEIRPMLWCVRKKGGRLAEVFLSRVPVPVDHALALC